MFHLLRVPRLSSYVFIISTGHARVEGGRHVLAPFPRSHARTEWKLSMHAMLDCDSRHFPTALRGGARHSVVMK